MKKIIIGVVLVLVLAIGGYVFTHNKAEAPDDDEITNTGPKVEAVISTLDKGVFLTDTKVQNATNTEVVSSSTVLLSASLKTNTTGRALVSMPSGKMIVDHDSDLALADLPQGQTSGTLTSGSVWSQVEKIFDKGEFYEIKTQNAVASVRGTSFGVSVKGGITTVIVTKGVVKVSPKFKEGDGDGDDDDLIGYDDSNSILITAGHKASIDDESNIKTSLITDEDKNNEWFIYNNSDKNPAAPTAATNEVKNETIVNPPKTTPPGPASPAPAPRSQTTIAPTTRQSSPQSASVTSGGGSAQTAPIKFEITSISPKTIPASSQTDVITINGNLFSDVVDVYVDTSRLDFGILSDNTITTGLPNQITPGIYSITLVNSKGEKVTAARALTVTQ